MRKFITFVSACLLTVGAYAQTFSGGSGTSADPYLISSEADLTELATLVTGGSNMINKHFELTKDLTITGTAPMIGYTGTVTPKTFAGTFNGKDHTIKGLDFGSKIYYTGLFASVTKDGTIKNLTLDGPVATSTNSYGGLLAGNCEGLIENCHIVNGNHTGTSGSFKGGLLGQNKGTVRGCSFTGTVSSASNAGGLVGQNYAKVENSWVSGTVVGTTPNNTSSTYGGITGITIYLSSGEAYVKDCYFTGSIQTALGNCAGGITGTLSKATMERCWTTAYIAANGQVGGLCNNIQKDGTTIKDCYFAGTIYNMYDAPTGGLVGYASTDATNMKVVNCLNYGTIFSAPVSHRPDMELVGSSLSFNNVDYAHLTNSFFDSQISGICTAERGKTTAELTSGVALEGFDTDVWEFTAGLYPRLKSTADNEMAQLYAVPVMLNEKDKATRVTSDFTLGKYKDIEWEITGTGAKLTGNSVAVTRGAKKSDIVLKAYLGNSERRALVSVYPVIFEEKGTADDPYLISNADDLLLLSNATNEQQLDFAGEYFRMTADIDMAGKEFIPFCYTVSGLAFSGTFDGGGYSIKNLQLDSKTNSVLNVGIFRVINTDGVVKNLKIDSSCKFDIYRNFGTIACINYGTVDNCRNYADIPTAEGYSGGLVYQSYGKILNSFNGGNMSASVKNCAMAGITYNNEGEVTNCQNSGNITALGNATTSTNAAGIVVSNKGAITNVLNTGRLETGTNVAGILADNKAGGTLTNALNLGQVTSFLNRDYLSATVTKDAGGKFSNVFYDTQIGIYGAPYEGITGYETAILTIGQLPINDPAWTASAGRYPLLTLFADEPASKVAAIPVYVVSGMRCDQLTENATLTEAEGLKWDVTGEAFVIDGKVLKVTNSDKVQPGVLTATYGGASHSYDIAAFSVIFEGKGTKENPYLIKSAADMIKLSADVESAGLEYAGKYFEVTNDLDFDGLAYSPVAGQGTIQFKGIIDGKKHTVTNLAVSSEVEGTGFIGRIGDGGAISNLTIDKTCSFKSTKANTGAFVGICAGKVDNCKNYANVSSTITSNSNVGGIVGQLTGYGEISNCENYANLSGSKVQVAGIVGYVNPTAAKVTNVTNYGDISTSSYAGGCIGNSLNVEIKNAKNYGTITGTSSNTGGIVAYIKGTWSIDGVENYGTINGYSNVGGIIGYAYSNGELNNAINAGNVTGTASIVGGIIGNSQKPTMNKVINVGNVTNSKTSLGSTTCGAGGLVATGDPIITDGCNLGTVSAERNLGGIVGRYYSSVNYLTLTNVYQAGKVVSTLATPTGYSPISSNHATAKCTFNNVYFDTQVNPGMTHAVASEIKSAALATLDLGENWDNVKDALPILKVFANNDYARLYSATVLLSENDHHGSVTDAFTASTAHGVVWSNDDKAFEIDGSKVSPAVGVAGDHVLTAKLGDLTRSITLTLTGKTSGVEEAIATDGAEAEYYDLNGCRIYGKPAPGVYIEKRGKTVRKVIL